LSVIGLADIRCRDRCVYLGPLQGGVELLLHVIGDICGGDEGNHQHHQQYEAQRQLGLLNPSFTKPVAATYRPFCGHPGDVAAAPPPPMGRSARSAALISRSPPNPGHPPPARAVPRASTGGAPGSAASETAIPYGLR